MTRTISLQQLANDAGALTREVADQAARIVVEDNGKPVAAIVPLVVLEADEEQRKAREEMSEAMHQLSVGFADLSEEELQALIAECVVEARAEIRQTKLEQARALVAAADHA